MRVPCRYLCFLSTVEKAVSTVASRLLSFSCLRNLLSLVIPKPFPMSFTCAKKTCIYRKVDHYQPRSGEIMYLVASVGPFVCVCSPVRTARGSALPSAAKSKEEPLPVQSVCLCACNQWAYADNCADAVDRLLMLRMVSSHQTCQTSYQLSFGTFYSLLGYLFSTRTGNHPKPCWVTLKWVSQKMKGKGFLLTNRVYQCDKVWNVSGRNKVFCYIRCWLSPFKATLLHQAKGRGHLKLSDSQLYIHWQLHAYFWDLNLKSLPSEITSKSGISHFCFYKVSIMQTILSGQVTKIG